MYFYCYFIINFHCLNYLVGKLSCLSPWSPWRQLIWLITQLIRQTNKTFLNFRFGKHSSYQLESHAEDKSLQGGPKTRLELPNGPTIETGEEHCKKIFLSLKNIMKICILSISILIYSQRNPTKQVWTSGLSVQILAWRGQGSNALQWGGIARDSRQNLIQLE